MKKRLVLSAVLFFTLILSGCNTDDDKVTDVPENVPVEDDGAGTGTDSGAGTDTGTDTDTGADSGADTGTGTGEDTSAGTGTGADSQADTNQNEDFAFNFTHFDLDVDYSGNEEYDVEYENERNEMEAQIKDDQANSHLHGDEAFAVLQPIFEQFTFDKNTPNEEVISEVISAFELEEGYTQFELEIEFADGTEKEYNDRK